MEDLIIIGGGPAGMTAGLYAARARLGVTLLERLAPGGQVLNTDWVENYPGFPEGISGFELVDRMRRQAEGFGLDIRSVDVTRLEFSREKKTAFAGEDSHEAKAVILTTGATPHKLDIEGEELLIGKGVSYCATCDGPFYKGEEVALVGGGDTAVEEALFLTRFVERVNLIHRRRELRATRILQERAMENEKIRFFWDTVATRITGEDGVQGVDLQNVKTGEESHLPVHGVFVFVGYKSNAGLVEGLVDLDDEGFVITDADMQTSVPGVFAAGDVRSKLLRQVSTAVGEGATAAFAAEKYIENL